MWFQFRQAVHILGRDYKRGPHHIEDERVIYHATFLKYVQAGLIVEGDAPVKKVTLESQTERSQRLFDKLVGGRDIHQAKKMEGKAPKVETPKAAKPEVPPPPQQPPGPGAAAPDSPEIAAIKAKAEAAAKGDETSGEDEADKSDKHQGGKHGKKK